MIRYFLHMNMPSVNNTTKFSVAGTYRYLKKAEFLESKISI